MRKIIIILEVLILLVFSIWGLIRISNSRNTDSILTRISNIVNVNNKLDLKFRNIDSNKIRISWTSEDSKEKVIFEHQEKIAKIGYNYGPNTFNFYYDGKLISTVSQFKKNNWHSHDYSIELIKDEEKFRLLFVANGPDYRKCILNFKDGVYEGKQVYYYDEQNIELISNYKNGKKHGLEQGFYKNGYKKFECKYDNGEFLEEVVRYGEEEKR